MDSEFILGFEATLDLDADKQKDKIMVKAKGKGSLFVCFVLLIHSFVAGNTHKIADCSKPMANYTNCYQ